MFLIALALSFCARERKRYYDAGGQPVNEKAVIHGAGRIYISVSCGFVTLGKWSSEHDVKTAGNEGVLKGYAEPGLYPDS